MKKILVFFLLIGLIGTTIYFLLFGPGNENFSSFPVNNFSDYTTGDSDNTSDNNQQNNDNNQNQNGNDDEQQAPISVSQPQAQDVISEPFVIRGQARVFEGQLNYRLKSQNENILKEGTITTERAEPSEFADYSLRVEEFTTPSQRNGTLEVFDTSARTGEPENLVSVPVVFSNYQEISFSSQIYTGPDNNFRFKYPENWYIEETITDTGQGAFGTIESAWILSTFELDNQAGSGGIPEGSIKIDFEIGDYGTDFDLQQLTQCDSQETQCNTITANGIQYVKSYSPGGQVPSVLYATKQGNIVYRASALFGSQQDSTELKQNIELVDEIVETFEII